MNLQNECCREVKDVYKNHGCSNNARGAYVTKERMNNLLVFDHFDITNTDKLKVCNTMCKRIVRYEKDEKSLKNDSFRKIQKKYSAIKFDNYLGHALSCKSNRK